MSRVRKIKHRPKVGIRIRFTNLIKGRLVRIDNLVDRGSNTGVLYRPAKVTGSFAAHAIVRARGGCVGSGGGGGGCGCAVGWVELGYAEITLRGRGEEVVDRVLL